MQHRWQFPNLQVFFGFFSVWTRPPPLCRIFPENANLSKFVFLTGNFFFAKIKSFKIHFIIEEKKIKKLIGVLLSNGTWYIYMHRDTGTKKMQLRLPGKRYKNFSSQRIIQICCPKWPKMSCDKKGIVLRICNKNTTWKMWGQSLLNKLPKWASALVGTQEPWSFDSQGPCLAPKALIIWLPGALVGSQGPWLAPRDHGWLPWAFGGSQRRY